MAQQHYLAVITVVLLGGLPAIISSLRLLPTNLETTRSSPDGLYYLKIEDLPSHAYVTAGEKTCSGIIIHNNWVLVLRSCAIVEENGSDIKVHTGGATPDEIRQVLDAHIHRRNDGPAGGFALLHLNDSLEFDEYVQPVTLPRRDLGYDWFIGFAAGFASKDNQVRLTAYVGLYNRSYCPSEDFLCILRYELPLAERTVGIDFFEIGDYQGDDKIAICLVGGKMETIGNILDKYYPIVDVLPWIQEETGLKFAPKPPSSGQSGMCGLLQ